MEMETEMETGKEKGKMLGSLGYAFEALFGPFTAFSYLFIFILFICLYYYLCTALDYFCRLRCISLEPSDVRLARV